MRALCEARRQGGTWHGVLSLAQLAHWLVSAGESAAGESPSGEPDPAPYSAEIPSAAGTLTVVRPPGTPVWSRGPVAVEPEHARWGHPRAP